MSSSRSDRSRPGRKKFPTAWTPWEWNAAYNCNYRWRQVAANNDDNDYEYQYQYDEQTPRDQNVDPASTLETIIEGQQDVSSGSPPGDNYTYGQQAVDDLTGKFQYQTLTTPYYSTAYSTTANPVQHTSTPAHSTNTYQYQTPTLAPGVSTTSPFQSSIAGPGSSFPNELAVPARENQRHISTANPGSKYELDRNFKLHRSYEFKFGRIFKVLWSEPTGSSGTEITRPKGNRQAKFGEKAYDSVRRFVIIREGDGHCICLPILTYGGQGTLKKGIHAEHHTIIYTSKSPEMKHGERITKKPVKMEPATPRDKLDPTSRINYAKVYTVEHNVKVHFVGKIVDKYEQRVVTDYNRTHQPLPDRPYFSVDEEEYRHTEVEATPYRYGGENEYDGPTSSSAGGGNGQTEGGNYAEDQAEVHPQHEDPNENTHNDLYDADP